MIGGAGWYTGTCDRAQECIYFRDVLTWKYIGEVQVCSLHDPVE